MAEGFKESNFYNNARPCKPGSQHIIAIALLSLSMSLSCFKSSVTTPPRYLLELFYSNKANVIEQHWGQCRHFATLSDRHRPTFSSLFLTLSRKPCNSAYSSQVFSNLPSTEIDGLSSTIVINNISSRGSSCKAIKFTELEPSHRVLESSLLKTTKVFL